jgi:hypothetical protein
MFLCELKPLTQKFCQEPVAFAGGLFSGLLHLKLAEEPLKTWLSKQGISNYSPAAISQQPQNIVIE